MEISFPKYILELLVILYMEKKLVVASCYAWLLLLQHKKPAFDYSPKIFEKKYSTPNSTSFSSFPSSSRAQNDVLMLL